MRPSFWTSLWNTKFLKTKYLYLGLTFLMNMWMWWNSTWNSEPVICKGFSFLSPPPIISSPLPPARPSYNHGITGYPSRVSVWPWKDNFDLFKGLLRGILRGALGLQKRRGSKRTGPSNRRHREGGISSCIFCPSLYCWGWPSAIPGLGGKGRKESFYKTTFSVSQLKSLVLLASND